MTTIFNFLSSKNVRTHLKWELFEKLLSESCVTEEVAKDAQRQILNVFEALPITLQQLRNSLSFEVYSYHRASGNIQPEIEISVSISIPTPRPHPFFNTSSVFGQPGYQQFNQTGFHAGGGGGNFNPNAPAELTHFGPDNTYLRTYHLGDVKLPLNKPIHDTSDIAEVKIVERQFAQAPSLYGTLSKNKIENLLLNIREAVKAKNQAIMLHNQVAFRPGEGYNPSVYSVRISVVSPEADALRSAILVAALDAPNEEQHFLEVDLYNNVKPVEEKRRYPGKAVEEPIARIVNWLVDGSLEEGSVQA